MFGRLRLWPCRLYLSSALVLAILVAAVHLSLAVRHQQQPVSFSNASFVSREASESDLLEELKGTLGRGHGVRVAELEAALKPMFATLPKLATNVRQFGKLDHVHVRYALHRILAQEHGWFVKGLAPDGKGMMAARSIGAKLESLREWIPGYLQKFLEDRTGGRGIGLHELAVLAVTIEDLVHREAIGRLETLYGVHEIPLDSKVPLKLADDLLDSFMYVFHRGGNWTVENSDDAWAKLERFRKHYRSNWTELESFMGGVRKNATRRDFVEGDEIDFRDMSATVEEFGNKYTFLFDQDCKTMKDTLVKMEDQRPGRVLLKSFYDKNIYIRWAFNEKVEYLRMIGALDETEPARPRVIVQNYIGSRPQCLEASTFYAVCCLSECDGLLGELERQIGAPTATLEQISALVAKLASSTVPAPRTLPDGLLERLKQVADSNAGAVPIHGRLFAQWMHHAYPRECPFPHKSGTTRPITADQWMSETGAASIAATEEEMDCHVNGNCAGGASDPNAATALADEESKEIPWEDHEEEL